MNEYLLCIDESNVLSSDLISDETVRRFLCTMLMATAVTGIIIGYKE